MTLPEAFGVLSEQTEKIRRGQTVRGKTGGQMVFIREGRLREPALQAAGSGRARARDGGGRVVFVREGRLREPALKAAGSAVRIVRDPLQVRGRSCQALSEPESLIPGGRMLQRLTRGLLHPLPPSLARRICSHTGMVKNKKAFDFEYSRTPQIP